MDFVNICHKALYFRGSLSICPAYAGVIPVYELMKGEVKDLSRVCGGDPVDLWILMLVEKFVPRMRG